MSFLIQRTKSIETTENSVVSKDLVRCLKNHEILYFGVFVANHAIRPESKMSNKIHNDILFEYQKYHGDGLPTYGEYQFERWYSFFIWSEPQISIMIVRSRTASLNWWDPFQETRVSESLTFSGLTSSSFFFRNLTSSSQAQTCQVLKPKIFF
jgi:hypothetical protein